MTSKRARKLMMAAGISRNKANHWLRYYKPDNGPKEDNLTIMLWEVCFHSPRNALRLMSSWKGAKMFLG